MLGDEKVDKLMRKNVLVIGLGGVGGICAEMIVRAGIGKMTIIDNDTIDASNINRQIPALHSTIKKSKAQVLAARLLDINPLLGLTIVEAFVEDESMIALIEKEPWDYVVDCIDTLSAKVDLIKG
jgi:tRNA A37 threonylcarbamoyladenosine dehydratase